MRALLAAINRASAILAGVMLVAIAVFTLIQITARFLGVAAHSWDEIAVFCMAGASFMGLAYTWRAQAHIRMTLLITQLPPKLRRVADIFALSVMAFIVAYMTWHLVDMSYLSWEMNDVSQGLLPMPLWIPQAVMALGSALLLLAVLETLYDALILKAVVRAGGEEDALKQSLSEV